MRLRENLSSVRLLGKYLDFLVPFSPLWGNLNSFNLKSQQNPEYFPIFSKFSKNIHINFEFLTISLFRRFLIEETASVLDQRAHRTRKTCLDGVKAYFCNHWKEIDGMTNIYEDIKSSETQKSIKLRA